MTNNTHRILPRSITKNLVHKRNKIPLKYPRKIVERESMFTSMGKGRNVWKKELDQKKKDSSESKPKYVKKDDPVAQEKRKLHVKQINDEARKRLARTPKKSSRISVRYNKK